MREPDGELALFASCRGQEAARIGAAACLARAASGFSEKCVAPIAIPSETRGCTRSKLCNQLYRWSR